ncbi:MAG: hypothetical protein U9R15_16545 [Chloroflexota bacterium]|nr:hypothetical protein [Chloroflexota bacterium]
MDRREFFKTGAKAAAAGAAVSIPTGVIQASDTPPTKTIIAKGDPGTSVVMKDFTADDHRRRLQNIGICTQKICKCMRKHLVTNYLPGQCCYNLGEYPCRKPWEIGEYDEQELDRLKNHGIQLIQVFDDWNDSIRLFGGDKYTSLNPDGYRRFIELAHQRGIKVLTYTSTGFLQWTDPDFRQEWSPVGSRCSLGFWDMARCAPGSPGWRAYLLPRIAKIVSEYEVDGIYIDAGYFTNAAKKRMPDASPLKKPAKDEMAVFEETLQYDGALTDLLALIYSEVNRRGGVMKLHVDGALEPQTGGQKVYDYLWVGEGVGCADGLRKSVKNHAPYVVPCIDTSFATVENANEQYLHAIPYMQFPILHAGKPFTGERGMIPGVRYVSDNDFWMKRCREVWKYHQAYPNGPHVYSGWDAVPPRAETRPAHARWLKQYMPLVEEGTWAYLEIGDSDLFAKPLPKDCVASAFANRELYVVLANYSQSPQQIETAETYVPVDNPSVAPAKHWKLPKRSLRILRRSV